ncbi:3661_t:CDS:2, partial [Racocetra fulgida]
KTVRIEDIHPFDESVLIPRSHDETCQVGNNNLVEPIVLIDSESKRYDDGAARYKDNMKYIINEGLSKKGIDAENKLEAFSHCQGPDMVMMMCI